LEFAPPDIRGDAKNIRARVSLSSSQRKPGPVFQAAPFRASDNGIQLSKATSEVSVPA